MCVRETITPHRDGRPTKTRGKKKIDHKRHVIDERVGRALYYSGGEHARSPKRRARARARRPCARDEGTTWVDTHRAAGSQWTGRSGRGLFAARGVPPRSVRAKTKRIKSARGTRGPGREAREKNACIRDAGGGREHGRRQRTIVAVPFRGVQGRGRYRGATVCRATTTVVVAAAVRVARRQNYSERTTTLTGRCRPVPFVRHVLGPL